MVESARGWRSRGAASSMVGLVAAMGFPGAAVARVYATWAERRSGPKNPGDGPRVHPSGTSLQEVFHGNVHAALPPGGGDAHRPLAPHGLRRGRALGADLPP